MTAPSAIVLLYALLCALALAIGLLERRSARVGRIARLHVVLQFELSSGQWEDAEEDLKALERIPGGVDSEIRDMVRATIAEGLAQRIPPPPRAAPVFDEEAQSYLTGLRDEILERQRQAPLHDD